MPKRRGPHPLKRHDLRRILRHHGCDIRLNRGRGGHWCAFRTTDAGPRLYPFSSRHEYPLHYIKSARRHLKLMPEDGVSDADFFNA